MTEAAADSRRSNRSAQRGRRLSDARWEKILDAAAEIFAERGYEGTTIRDIADAAGILSGSLYYYISTKEDLLFALIANFHELGSREIDDAEADAEATSDGDALVVLRAVLVKHVELNATHGNHSAVFHNDFRRLDVERRTEIVRSRRTHETRLERLVAKAQKDGTIRADLDPRLAALSMLSMLNSIHHWYHPGRGLGPRAIGEFQADLLLQGAMVQPADNKDDR